MMFRHQPGGVPVREVVLHCAAIKTGQFAHMGPFEVYSTINRWHTERGFRFFGYHGLVMPSGEIYPGRPFNMEGAHVAGHNRGTLGLLLIEHTEIKQIGDFVDYFTHNQRVAARAWIKAIPGIERVTGHNDHAAKLCPGFKVESHDWL
ncbi:hypothetical protein [Pararhodobacter sp.]|uniref:hypothetical protein n=1 Tax=Pararhodobacter sp. TaxID=2127056 RepID=UPI002FE3E3D0